MTTPYRWGFCNAVFRQHRLGLLQIVPTILLLLLSNFALGSCTHRAARIPVTNEDIIKSNEVYKEGDIAFARKDYYAALIKYLEASRLNPNNEYIFNRIGIVYSQLNYYQEALTAFRRSMQLNPKYSYSYNNTASVYFALKDLKKAEKYFHKAIALNKNEASFHMNLGSLYFEKKKYDRAMAEWRKGLALDPDILSKRENVSLVGGSTPAKEKNYYLARLYASLGDVVRTIELLEQAFLDGFSDLTAIEKAAEFDPIRKDERFVAFMQKMELLIKLRPKTGSSAAPSNNAPSRAQSSRSA